MSELRLEQDGDDVLLWVKAVPGASRDEIAGLVGERLKVRISAAAEGGKANKAICAVIARALKCKPRQVAIESGQTNPEKIVRITAMGLSAVRDALA